MCSTRTAQATSDGPVRREKTLVLTPMKDATGHLGTYFECLRQLDYPRELLSVGFLEGDSRDGTYDELAAKLPLLREQYACVTLWKKDYGLKVPDGMQRWAPAFQIPRRKVLARARNHLLSRALADEMWVLWLDVDVTYPSHLLKTLIAVGHDIVHPHCVKKPGGATFDRNAWRDHGRVHMDQLRGQTDLVRLDSVGGTVLLVRADLHRDGLVFPPFLYGRAHPAVRRPGPWGEGNEGEIETEGFALMAADMGYRCWGMPNLEVLHAEH
jgi:Anp1